MAGRKLSKPNPAFSLEEIQSALNNEETRSALTDTPADFTGGTLQGTIQRAEAAEEAAMAPEQEYTFAEKLAAARRGTITHAISSTVLDSFLEDEFIDFDPTLNRGEAARRLLASNYLPDNEENLIALSAAGTLNDMAKIADRLKKHQFDLQVLNEHGGWSLASGMLDPTTLIVDAATFGTTKALKLGRIATAASGATATTGVLGAGDLAGADVDGFDYVLGAALGGAAFGLFGGEAANRIKDGTGNWYGALQNPNTGAVTRFFSEADTIAPTPEARAYTKAIIDDPLRREEFFVNDNAPSIKRRLDNVTEKYKMDYDSFVENTLKEQGFGNWLKRTADLNGSYSEAKDIFNRQVANELLRRNDEFHKFGRYYPTDESPVTKAADIYQNMMNASGRISKESGLPGFEDFIEQPGYFHRSWNASKINALINNPNYGKDKLRALLALSIRKGIGADEIDESTASVMAGTLIDRSLAKNSGRTLDAAGVSSKYDMESMFALLDNSGADAATVAAIRGRLESKIAERGLPKYARGRIPMDMSLSYTAADGTTVRVSDLIDTDLDRLANNYLSSMNGRAALAKAGIGKDDAEINTWMTNYEKTIAHLPKEQFDTALNQMRGLLGDFTGNIPRENVLGPIGRRASALASSTMLSAQGIWQATEYATMAWRYGAFNTAKEFVKQFPGIKSALKEFNGKPELVDEMNAILGLDLARDVRYRPWMKQADAFLDSTNTWIDRFLHMGKQAMPFLTVQKYIHGHQTRMASNLALQKLGRAMQGDTAALDILKSYGRDVDWSGIIERNKGYVTRNGSNGPVTEMNWSVWSKQDTETVMNTVLRLIDDTVLFGRSSQGSAFARSREGQILGQFRSFVSYAHNKLLRGTLHNDGVFAFASLLAFQYPLTVLLVTLNEARKGKLGDLEDEDYLKELMAKSFGYTAGLGFFADAAGVLGLTGGRGGVGVPLMAATQAPAQVIRGLSAQFDDSTTNNQDGFYDIAKGASAVIPVLNGIPGTQLAIEAMKGD